MIFASPWWLLMIPLVLIFPWIRGGASVPFSSISLVAARRTWRTRLWALPRILASLSGVCLIVGLARPQEEFRERFLEKDGIDIMLVVDTSGSMDGEDFRMHGITSSRMDVSKVVMEEFVQQRPNDRIGLVVFGEEAYTFVPLTLDHSGMTSFLRSITVGLAGSQSTAIGDGIAIAAKRLIDREDGSKIMIVLTDGQSNAGVDPVEAAMAAAEFGIRVYTIGIGDDSRGMFGLFSKRSSVDERTLNRVAKVSDGVFYRAKDTSALKKIYNEINALEPSTAEYTEYVHREEKFAVWIVISCFLLLAHVILSETWLRRIP